MQMGNPFMGLPIFGNSENKMPKFTDKKLEPVFIKNVCGFSSIILLQSRQKSAGGLSPGKDF